MFACNTDQNEWWLQNDAVFTAKQLIVSTVSMLTLKTKFEGFPRSKGSTYIRVTYDVAELYINNDVTLLSDNQSQSSL